MYTVSISCVGRGGVSSSEQVWTGFQSWPPDVSAGGGVSQVNVNMVESGKYIMMVI